MARPKKTTKYIYRNSGRPTKLTAEVVRKLEESFGVGANVKQACYYADISTVTFYDWIKKNPELSNRLTELREKLPLQALYNIAKKITDDKDMGLSKWLVERRIPEFRETINLNPVEDNNDDDGDAHAEDSEVIREFHDKLKNNLRSRNIKKAKEDGEIK